MISVSFRVSFHLLVLLWGLFASQIRAAELAEVQLTLPAEIYAVAGSETGVYFANTVLTEKPTNFRFVVDCAVGKAEKNRWQIIPKAEEVGKHSFTISVFNSAGEQLASASSTLIVSPADAGKESHVRLLLVGDSLTNASRYPNKIASLLETPGNPTFEMLGTHKPKGAAENVAHEGYGGWTWQRFAEHFEPNPDGTLHKKTSPFVFLDEEGRANLDIQRYIDEHCAGKPPNVVVFKLGINDCFHADPDKLEAIDLKVDSVFGYAEKLVDAFRKVAPEATIGICLTTPGNARDSAFKANYGDRYTRWGWKRIQHRLVQRQLEQFSGRERENIFLIPTELNLDTQDGYPADNSVHPNSIGYDQIGTTIFAWLKYRCAESP